MNNAASALPFHGLKIVELAEDTAGELTGRLFADLGANVIKLEPPEGAPSRYVGPFERNMADRDHSLNFRFYNRQKRSAVLDVTKPGGLKKLLALLQTADIFICTLQPAALRRVGLNYEAIRAATPQLIILSVTPFGLTGPWRDYKSSDLVALAAGGPLHMTGYSDHSIPPIRPGGDQAYHTAASFAYSGAVLALIHRRRTKRGQVVDVSMHDSCAVTVEMAFAYWVYAKSAVHRQTCRHAQPEPSQPTLFECADGRYVYFVLVLAQAKPWAQLVAWLDSHGFAADLKDAAYSDIKYRQDNFHHVQGICEAFFLTHNADDMFREGQGFELPVGVLYRPEDLLRDPHLKERKFFEEVEEATGQKVIYPGPPSQYSNFQNIKRRGAPELGAHTAEVLTTIG